MLLAWRGADFPPDQFVQQISDELQRIPPWLTLSAYSANACEADIGAQLRGLEREESDQLRQLDEQVESKAPQAMQSALERLESVTHTIERVLSGYSNDGLSDLAKKWQELITTRKELEYLQTLDQELSGLGSLQNWYSVNSTPQNSSSKGSNLSKMAREWIRLNEQKSDLSRLPKFQTWRRLVLEKTRASLIVACHASLDDLWKTKNANFESQFAILDVLAKLEPATLEQNILMYVHLYALEAARGGLLTKSSLSSLEIEGELRAGSQKFNAILNDCHLTSTGAIDVVVPCITKKIQEEILAELIRFSAAEILAIYTRETQACQVIQLPENKPTYIEPQDSEKVKLRFLIMLERLLKRDDWSGDHNGALNTVIRRNNIFDTVLPFTDLWIAADRMAVELWMADPDWKAVAMNGVPTRGFLCTNAVVRVSEAILSIEQRIRLLAPPNPQWVESYTDKVVIQTLIEPVLQLLKNRWNDSDDPFGAIDSSLCILNSVDFLSEELQQVLQDLPVGKAKTSIDKLKDRLISLFADHLLENVKESEVILDPYHISDAMFASHFEIISCNISVETADSLAKLLERHFIHLFNRLIAKKDNKRNTIPGQLSNKVCLQTNLKMAIWVCKNLCNAQIGGGDRGTDEEDDLLFDSDLTILLKSIMKI